MYDIIHTDKNRGARPREEKKMKKITINGIERSLITEDELFGILKGKYELAKRDALYAALADGDTYAGKDADAIIAAVSEATDVSENDIDLTKFDNDDARDLNADGIISVEKIIRDEDGDIVNIETLGYILL